MALLDELSVEIREMVIAEVAKLRSDVLLAALQRVAEKPIPTPIVQGAHVANPITVLPAPVEVAMAEVNVDMDVEALGVAIGDRVAGALAQPMEAIRTQLAALYALMAAPSTKHVERDREGLISDVVETRRA